MGTTFGESLKKLRQEKNLTLVELSSKSGVTHIQINNLEKGRCKPSANTLYKLSRALDVSYDYLFNESLK